ncbi:potassium voltage-gated channel protein Shal-like [Tropilaelaps mercedesae]|uniref:Potassium voltage-gated channel protein Shal-like n=1 Tax=Tropilaelaps mercedesae TaxID=418985 RepID=A0A1V9XFI2_9ACAR|nr:potassium voltage-gated channel protein Shal-like [Tropilaelaps mercedesae]
MLSRPCINGPALAPSFFPFQDREFVELEVPYNGGNPNRPSSTPPLSPVASEASHERHGLLNSCCGSRGRCNRKKYQVHKLKKIDHQGYQAQQQQQQQQQHQHTGKHHRTGSQGSGGRSQPHTQLDIDLETIES